MNRIARVPRAIVATSGLIVPEEALSMSGNIYACNFQQSSDGVR
jgi:hypothetical protein